MKHIVEHFVGHVISIKKDSFCARYEDIAENEEEAEFIIDKVLNEKEKEHLKIGMPFDLIFFNDESFEFKFIVEYWTQKELDEVKKEAEILIKKFNWLPIAED